MNISRFPVFEYINAATGWEKTPDEYFKIGWRVHTLKQVFNIRHGIDPWHFKMHPRAYSASPQTAGPHKGKVFDPN